VADPRPALAPEPGDERLAPLGRLPAGGLAVVLLGLLDGRYQQQRQHPTGDDDRRHRRERDAPSARAELPQQMTRQPEQAGQRIASILVAERRRQPAFPVAAASASRSSGRRNS
jgi:hypothetical protein